MALQLYLLTYDKWEDYTYDACIVCARDVGTARQIAPGGKWDRSWAPSPEHVNCVWVGTAAEGMSTGVVLASFNAG